ncbi:RcnB family protein [Lysobacter xanthus]
MNRMVLASTIAALLLAGPAFAGNGHGQGHGKAQAHGKAQVHAKGGHDTVVLPVPGVRVDTRVDTRGASWKAEGRHDNGLHLGQKKQMWARGERLPRNYLDDRYYVRDYRDYDLMAPPPGTVWVRPYQDSRNFYLVQVATGIISQIFGR